uniref:60 kDa SS-A/Ro ribonucleoprotein n=1 Tax=Magallana gigas TaxID=29159 RepID=K1PZM2_MAGGI
MYDFLKEDEFEEPEEYLNSDRTQSKSERSQIHNVPKTIDEIRLSRFLCLGTENGTYHTDEIELTCRENVGCIDRLINKGEGLKVVETIREFSIEGKACKATPIIFALSICCRCNDHKTKDAAYKILSDVCRIPTHLFEFIKYCQDVNPNGDGWGRAHRKGVSMWYENYRKRKGGIPLLAFHMTKYKSRFGFTHRDVFRLCHIKTDNDALGYLVYHFCRNQNQTDINWSEHLELAKQKEGFEQSELKKVIDLLQVFDDAKNCHDEEMMKRMILKHHPYLVREHVPTELLNSKKFLKYSKDVNPENKGWGRAHRKGVSMWYHNYKIKKGGFPLLAYHMTKYKSRFGFTHKDIFRLCHIKTGYDALGYLVNYFCRKEGQRDRENNLQSRSERARREGGSDQLKVRKIIDQLQLYDVAKNCNDEEVMRDMISNYYPVLAREHVPTGLLNSREAYSKGKGELGNLRWRVNPKISNALQEAFCLSCNYVATTRKRYLLAIDVSCSMDVPVLGTPTITARDAAAAMAMVTVRTPEQSCDVVAFSGNRGHANTANNEDQASLLHRKLDAGNCVVIAVISWNVIWYYLAE